MSIVQEQIDKLRYNDFSNDEILKFLESEFILVKLNAIIAVVRLGLNSEKIISQLQNIAEKIDKESRVFGVWNNGHFALAALKLLNTKMSIDMYEELLSHLDDTAKADIDRLISQWPEIMLYVSGKIKLPGFGKENSPPIHKLLLVD